MKTLYVLTSLVAALLIMSATANITSDDPIKVKQDVELVFYTPPQTTDTLQNLINRYNTMTEGVNVSLEERMWSTTDLYSNYISRFQNEDSSFDILSVDVIWPAYFAANGWLEPLGGVFPQPEREKFFQAHIKAASYGDEIYGMPWFHDSGLLYYRTDILTDAFDNGLIPKNRAPQTWAELHDWTLTMLSNTTFISKYEENPGEMKGFVWQGKAYEGLSCDFMEYLGGTGQHSWLNEVNGIYSPNVDTPQFRNALEYMRSLIADGVSPEAVVTYAEEESRAIWNRGNAIFHRNWPYAYQLGLQSPAINGTDTGDDSQVFAVAPMPAQDLGGADLLTSTLGGWQLGINAFSNHADEAKDFILWLTQEQQQLAFFEGNGNLPTRLSAYDADKINGTELDYIVEFREAFEKSIARPPHPQYTQMSQILWKQIHSVINGANTTDSAISEIEIGINAILKGKPKFFVAPQLLAIGHTPTVVDAGDQVRFDVQIGNGEFVEQVNLIISSGETYNITMNTTDNWLWSVDFSNNPAGATVVYQIQVIDTQGGSYLSPAASYVIAGNTSSSLSSETLINPQIVPAPFGPVIASLMLIPIMLRLRRR